MTDTMPKPSEKRRNRQYAEELRQELRQHQARLARMPNTASVMYTHTQDRINEIQRRLTNLNLK